MNEVKDIKTMSELRESLLDVFTMVRRKEIDLKMADNLSNIAGKVINSVKMDLLEKTLLNDKTPVEFVPHNLKVLEINSK